MALGEFEIIRRFFDRRGGAGESASGVLLGIGDDAAVIEPGGPFAAAIDTLVEDVHFPAGMAPDALGHRSLAVNLSDLAAMGAQPRWAMLALTVPGAGEAWLEGFAAGFFALAERHGVALVGGDLTRGPLSVTVQVMGISPSARFTTRAGARPGDAVYVTGTLGDAAAGLALIQRGSAAEDGERARLRERFLRPVPRVAEGLALAGIAGAAIDVSDGLVADVGHLCEAAGCGAVIDVEHLPLSAALLAVCPREVAVAEALGGGDDYELCFSVSAERADAVARASHECGTPMRAVGRFVEGTGVVCRHEGRPIAPPRRGYLHFR